MRARGFALRLIDYKYTYLLKRMPTSKILISQVPPANQTPYSDLCQKYGVSIDFQPFFLIEPLSSREFRTQRLSILDYSAIVFSARHTIDAFFAICEELRIKVPDTMKYFCTTEAVAVYLQKHIVFRKRKIFYGTGTPASVLSLITAKHKGEKFLIATSGAGHNEEITNLFGEAKLDYATGVFVKPVSQDLKSIGLESYDVLVMCNPADLNSLRENFPSLDLSKFKIITFGRQIVKALEDASVAIELKAPSPEAPSVAKALELYLQSGAAIK